MVLKLYLELQMKAFLLYEFILLTNSCMNNRLLYDHPII